MKSVEEKKTFFVKMPLVVRTTKDNIVLSLIVVARDGAK